MAKGESRRVSLTNAAKFTAWLERKYGAAVRDGKGNYQLNQIFLSHRTPPMWHVISMTKEEHICTIPASLDTEFQQFLTETYGPVKEGYINGSD